MSISAVQFKYVNNALNYFFSYWHYSFCICEKVMNIVNNSKLIKNTLDLLLQF